jgi:peroxiredoxin
MPTIHTLLLLSCVLSLLPGRADAQDVGQASGVATTPAAARLAQLTALHAERMKSVDKVDKAATNAASAIHVRELLAFVRDYPHTTEANGTRLRIGFMARRDSAQMDAARIALGSFDMSIGEMGGGLMAIRAAKNLGLSATTKKLKKAMTSETKTISGRMDLVMHIKLGFKDAAWAREVLRETEEMASKDEQKADLLLGHARITLAQFPKDKAAYQKALEAVLAKFPATPAGQLVKDKLAAAKLAVGSDPIAFVAKDLQGETFSLEDYRGKVLLIDFWATWCAPCMKEVPHLVAVYDEFHDQGLEMLGISLDRESRRARMNATIAKRGMKWRHVCDGLHWYAMVAQQYDVRSIPFTILIGTDGKVAGLNLHGEELKAAVKAAIHKR